MAFCMNFINMGGGGGVIAGCLTDLFKQIWRERKAPKDWAESKVTLIHKGGHKSKKNLKNYRPIVLMNAAGKIFCTIIKWKLEEYVESNRVLGDEQNRFRAGRRETDNIFIVGEITTVLGEKGQGRELFF